MGIQQPSCGASVYVSSYFSLAPPPLQAHIHPINHRHRHVLRVVASPAKVSLVHLTFDLTLHLSSRRDWVAKCLGQMNDANRAEAQAELRQVIADAFTAKTLWTTDWAGVQLQRYRFPLVVYVLSPVTVASVHGCSLVPKPPPTLKRKMWVDCSVHIYAHHI